MDSNLSGRKMDSNHHVITPSQHVLLNPEIYIGSMKSTPQLCWVYEKDEVEERTDEVEVELEEGRIVGGRMKFKLLDYVPGLYRIFDEILMNAFDNKMRDQTMNKVRVTINREMKTISVYNNGKSVPVTSNDYDVLVPSTMFGSLMSSSHFYDFVDGEGKRRTTARRHGLGAKLTNLFSTKFTVEIGDSSHASSKYKKVFLKNMTISSKETSPEETSPHEGEDYTLIKFEPDLEKFNMSCLEDDVVALMTRRAIDVAGCLDGVEVTVDGMKFNFNSFFDYCDLYLKSTSDLLPRIKKEHQGWQILITRSEGQFQQVSFVNGIATVKGGTHVDCITDKITRHIVDCVKDKNKLDLEPEIVKNSLWVFVNAFIDNPIFGSQAKETLTTTRSDLSWDFTELFDNVSNSEMMKIIELQVKEQRKRSIMLGGAKLVEANDAGLHADRCTLILTEGESAMALAIAGLAAIKGGRDHYGVFALRGKFLNVRDLSLKKIKENAVIEELVNILGLQYGKIYDEEADMRSLRYGKLMIMADQDHDGSHIKGLIINFIHTLWPSLLKKVPNFISMMVTPIIKVTHGDIIESFYTIPDYENWKQTTGKNLKDYTSKYYKGLGTSTDLEGMEYFENIEKQRKNLVWSGAEDDYVLNRAFSKKMATERKEWIRGYKTGTYLNHEDASFTYTQFVNRELILFSIEDNKRSIPSICDGLKPVERKVLYSSFKKNLYKEARVTQFSGYVSEHSAYHHGEKSLQDTIVSMAQDYVGSNNINLLKPNGQFGTRRQNGNDQAHARYLFTQLARVARSLFHVDDDILLNYSSEDGKKIEPAWYLPIIPMILVNGCRGIGTGWSTSVPKYNPLTIIKKLKHTLKNHTPDTTTLDPWYRGFKGDIKEAESEHGVVTTYRVTGIIEVLDATTVRISELPIGRSTQSYKAFLTSVTVENAKSKDLFIERFWDECTSEKVDFTVRMKEGHLSNPEPTNDILLKKFNLITSISTTNMNLFDGNGNMKKYASPDEILNEFSISRMKSYEKRKVALLDNKQTELSKCESLVIFVEWYLDGTETNREKANRFTNLDTFLGVVRIPTAKIGATHDAEETEDDGFGYLRSLPVNTFTPAHLEKLKDERDKLMQEVEHLKESTLNSLWFQDLEELEEVLAEEKLEYEKNKGN